MWRLVSLLFCLPSLATFVQAQPSFDCARAGTPTEHAICGSERLAALDRDIAAAYSAARRVATPPQADALKADQLRWLGRRDECGNQPDCLATSMEYWLMGLRDFDGSAPMQRDLSGVYCVPDYLKLWIEQRGEQLEFGFHLTAGNGHSCGMDNAIGQRSGNGWTAWMEDCELTIRQVGSEIVVNSSTSTACTRGYCGARAAIHHLSVPLTSRLGQSSVRTDEIWPESGC